MPSSCKELREALRECLQESDCVMIDRNSASDCLRQPLVDSLPLKCQQLKRGFGECKRGMIDMRKRFRGNMPVEYRTLQKADSGENYQLYAGRPALATGARITDGNEEEPRDWREVENEKYRAEMAKNAAAAAAEKPAGQQQQQQPQQSSGGGDSPKGSWWTPWR